MKLSKSEVDLLVNIIINDGQSLGSFPNNEALRRLGLKSDIEVAENKMMCSFYAASTESEAHRVVDAMSVSLSVRDRAEQMLREDGHDLRSLIDGATPAVQSNEFKDLYRIINSGGRVQSEDLSSLENVGMLSLVKRVAAYDSKRRDPDLYYIDRDSIERSCDILYGNLVDKARRVLYRGDYYNVEKWSEAKAPKEEFHVPLKIGRVEISSADRERLKSGGVIYVEGMYDSRGGTHNAYVRVNEERGKLDFFHRDPTQERTQAEETQSKPPQRRMKM